MREAAARGEEATGPVPSPHVCGPRHAPVVRLHDLAVRQLVADRAAEPVDVFFWNGTCEELVSWDEIGGVQPANRARAKT